MKNKVGFTLIEVLVTIMIIGILSTIVTFAVRQAQQSARDGKRKSDLETIAAGLELYRAECNRYPATAGFLTSGTLSGSTPPSTCTGTYITNVPTDPQPSQSYYYVPNGSGSSYALCARLETGGSSVSGCGSCSNCNYKITRP